MKRKIFENILKEFILEAMTAQVMRGPSEDSCGPGAEKEIRRILSQADSDTAMREILQGLFIKVEEETKKPKASIDALESVKNAVLGSSKSSMPPPPSGPAPVTQHESRSLERAFFGSVIKEGVEVYGKFCSQDLEKIAIEFARKYVEKNGEDAFKSVFEDALEGAKAYWRA